MYVSVCLTGAKASPRGRSFIIQVKNVFIVIWGGPLKRLKFKNRNIWKKVLINLPGRIEQ